MLLSILFSSLLLINLGSNQALAQDEIEAVDVESSPASDATDNLGAKDQPYVSPKLMPEGIYLYENFDDEQQFKSKWVQSADPKYEGRWQLDSGPDRPHADKQLRLPLKARHYAVSSKLSEPFKFSEEKPLIVQYEVQFREGLDCGGAYVKLLRNSAISDLNKLTDKTPFTIMFGPDKCGSESKLHFIVQYLNPKTQEYGEKHWKQAKFVSNLMSSFGDKKHHLFKLVLKPSNDFEIFLDDKSVGKGNLLDDMDPAINPPKEIIDANDSKPADWDERPMIEDPDARKPDNWDEDAPKQIEDPDAVIPSDWLVDEPKYIPDPEAKKPEDWEEMDGEWEAPLIENPACAQASGCGEWKPPMIANPNYKGKWKAPKIENPKYKGKWSPRMIPNPDYFYDENPFSSLDPIGAIAFELWSMADNVAFDNLIITNNVERAELLQFLTWHEKQLAAEANSPSLLTRGMHYLKVNPWAWVVVILGIAIPLLLFITYCCDTKRRASARPSVVKRKKTDESKPDDEERLVEEEEGEKEEAAEDEGLEDEEQDEGEAAEVQDDAKVTGDAAPSKRQVRQRKK